MTLAPLFEGKPRPPATLVVAILASLLGVITLGCDEDGDARGEATTSAAAPASHAASGAASSPRRPEANGAATASDDQPHAGASGGSKARETCRAIGVDGEVRAGQRRITRGSLLDGEQWLTLGAGASLTIKHGLSAREYRVLGPAQALPCYQKEERVLLESGRVETAQGFGARPGALVSVVTPRGLVRYGNAELTLRQESTFTLVEVRSGNAWLEPATGAKVSGQAKLAKGTSRLVGTPPTKALVKACEEAAERAAASARGLLEPAAKDAGSLGERASQQLKDRVAARSACLVARVALGPGPFGPKQAEIGARLERADRRWSTIPSAGSEPPR